MTTRTDVKCVSVHDLFTTPAGPRSAPLSMWKVFSAKDAKPVLKLCGFACCACPRSVSFFGLRGLSALVSLIQTHILHQTFGDFALQPCKGSWTSDVRTMQLHIHHRLG